MSAEADQYCGKYIMWTIWSYWLGQLTFGIEMAVGIDPEQSAMTVGIDQDQFQNDCLNFEKNVPKIIDVKLCCHPHKTEGTDVAFGKFHFVYSKTKIFVRSWLLKICIANLPSNFEVNCSDNYS